MKTIAAGQFKAKCLELMDKVNESKTELVITKRGVPVAKLVPVSTESRPKTYGLLADTAVEYGDLVSPIDEKWNADSDN